MVQSGRYRLVATRSGGHPLRVPASTGQLTKQSTETSAIMLIALGVKRRMLVLLSPEFIGSETQIEELSQATGW